MFELKKNFSLIQEKIKQACISSNRRSQDIALIAVSKTKPVEMIEEAFNLGVNNFGENYVQEWQEKQQALNHLNIQCPVLLDLPSKKDDTFLVWHFIGHLQKRKVKEVIGKVSLIHSVDSLELLEEIDKRAQSQNLIQNCLLQINIGKEESKGGIHPEKAEDFLRHANNFQNADLQGLMIIPPPSDTPEGSRTYFRKTRELLSQLNQNSVYRHSLNELSMGMSHDFEVAIEEGATMIRVGTALFGERYG